MQTSSSRDVFFTVFMCSLCAGILTFANVQWRDSIRANERFSHSVAVVDALGLVQVETRPDRDEVITAFGDFVREKLHGEMMVFEGRKADERLGYALDVEAHGKCGPIRGILAIGPRKDTIKALRIFQHNETPGLGGRIAEREWQDQFVGIPLRTKGHIGVEFGKKGVAPNEVDAITNASKTMFCLKKAINGTITRFLSGGMKLAAVDFGLDAVTEGTPGYPEEFDRPPHLREEVRRAPFLAAPGVRLLSLGKPATCSMDIGPIIGELTQLTDGVKTCELFDCVELDFDPQWVQVDLGEVMNVHCIAFWHFYKNPVIYRDVIVQVADDPEFTQNVRMLFNNDHDDSSGLGKGEDTAFFGRWWGEVVDTRGPDYEGMMTRCIRVWTNGSETSKPAKFVEVDVYGLPPRTAIARK